MSLSTEGIAERLYEWSLDEAEREVKRNFSFVRMVKGTNAEKYLRFFQETPVSDVFLVSQALVKRMNQPLLLRHETVLTDVEQEYVQSYLKFEEVSGPGGLRMIRADRPEATWTVELRRALKSLVKERFRREAGLLNATSSNEWIHESDLGCIGIRTFLDFGGRSSLSYSHMIFLRDGTVFRVHLSLLQWLGAASMTRWRSLRAEELINAADGILALCQHFISEMRVLFKH
jgi:hypothetical protein